MNKEMTDRKLVMHSPILPGTRSDGMNTDMTEHTQSITLGRKVCRTWLV